MGLGFLSYPRAFENPSPYLVNEIRIQICLQQVTPFYFPPSYVLPHKLLASYCVTSYIKF